MRFYVVANDAGEIVSLGSVVASSEVLEAQGLHIMSEYTVETDGTKIAIRNVEELAHRLSGELASAYNRLAAVERRVAALESRPGGTP